MRIIAALISALALTLLPTIPAHAAPASGSQVVGTWKGTSVGYEAGAYTSQETKWTITKSKGTTFAGTKVWRIEGGSWSAPEPVSGVILSTGEVRWSDADGVFIGELDGSRHIHGTYMEVGADQAVFHQHVRKVK